MRGSTGCAAPRGARLHGDGPPLPERGRDCFSSLRLPGIALLPRSNILRPRRGLFREAFLARPPGDAASPGAVLPVWPGGRRTGCVSWRFGNCLSLTLNTCNIPCEPQPPGSVSSCVESGSTHSPLDCGGSSTTLAGELTQVTRHLLGHQ